MSCRSFLRRYRHSGTFAKQLKHWLCSNTREIQRPVTVKLLSLDSSSPRPAHAVCVSFRSPKPPPVLAQWTTCLLRCGLGPEAEDRSEAELYAFMALSPETDPPGQLSKVPSIDVPYRMTDWFQDRP